MAILDTDIIRRYSGGSGNTSAAASLGGAISSTAISNDTLNALWPDFSGEESNDGITRYRCFYLRNSHASLTAKNIKIYFDEDELPENDGVTVELGSGTAAVNATEQTIADEETEPTGVTFDTYDSDNKLALSNIPNGQYKSIWVKLTTEPGAEAKNLDNYHLVVDVDTNE